jgi:hypothetical protein
MKTKKILILALTISAFSACRKGDDLYVNPNVPATATPAKHNHELRIGHRPHRISLDAA